MACAWVLSEPQACILVSRPLRVLTRWQVFDSPTWCEAALMALCRGHGEWRSYLVKSRIKVARELGMNLSGRAFITSQGCLEKELVARKQYF